MERMKCVMAMLLLSIVAGASLDASTRSISKSELRDKVAGAWIGQMVGNIYGLPFENKFIGEPAPESRFPFGYTKNMDKLRTCDGAFSDDDTDIEYMYLLLMEECGVEPTYAQIRESWMHHVRDRVWLANRAALGLMHFGYTPPFTGDKRLNPHWYQIDPQLINEIWAYTAPGMVSYAASKSDWAARVTSDSWAVSPTVLYGAMYAEAFFCDDVRELIMRGLEELPPDDRYALAVRDMLDLHDAHPNDWVAARQVMAAKYYEEEPAMTKTIWNANLNGLCGILAMLYGDGDFQRTLDLCCAMGFDCDNQAATISGLLGVMYGAKALPRNLTMPIEGWTKPFNDRYVNITRHDMPDASIEDMIDRTFDKAIELVCAKGGWVRGDMVHINAKARFVPPLEFCVGPAPDLSIGEEAEYSFACKANARFKWDMVDGTLPKGLSFKDGILSGTPEETGRFPMTLRLGDGSKSISKDFELLVRPHNIAPDADTIYASVRKLDRSVLDSCWTTFGEPMYASSVDVVNDGVKDGEGSVFYSLAAKSNIPKTDYFGYGWGQAHEIGMIGLDMGCLEEFGGWFTSLAVQYVGDDGGWHDVGEVVSTPELPETDTVFYQPHFAKYVLEFAPVVTKGIRVSMDAKVQSHWHKYTKNVSSFISITELEVYEASATSSQERPSGALRLTESELADKIRGGWAGQTIGVVFGAPVEFKFSGSYVQDYQPIPWGSGYVKHWWEKKPGLFDDIYNDCTFVEAFEELGLDCSQEALAKRFASADYHLAHANQAARYNIRQGVMPPASGHWLNNPHADDLDFQIEADFIGLMAPGMLPEAMEIASKVGHIMNSGDGFYGGAFVSAMYSLAFCEETPEAIVSKALSVIPAASSFHRCVSDVLDFHSLHPDNWKDCWHFLQDKWNRDVGCPKGVFLNFNIDARLNSAFVAMALLYGEGDFTKSLDIAARCGQDADCNPSTVGGVLGVLHGYDDIPSFWLDPLKEVESLEFAGTDMSLSKACSMSLDLAEGLIVRAGGSVSGGVAEIPMRDAGVLPLEQNFERSHPICRERKDCFMDDVFEFDFDGNGFVIWGNICCTRSITEDYINRVSTRHIGSEVFGLAEPDDPYVAEVEIWLDGVLDQVALLPMRNTDRKVEPAWKYLLAEGRHHVELRWTNRKEDYVIRINDIVYYSENEMLDRFYFNGKTD